MRTIQQIFDAVIAGKCYRSRNVVNSRRYMCWALEHAYNVRVITFEERAKGKEAIKLYLKNHTTLVEALEESGYGPKQWGLCKLIFKNWNARPTLKQPKYSPYEGSVWD